MIWFYPDNIEGEVKKKGGLHNILKILTASLSEFE
jgi:hypothetical protein